MKPMVLQRQRRSQLDEHSHQHFPRPGSRPRSHWRGHGPGASQPVHPGRGPGDRRLVAEATGSPTALPRQDANQAPGAPLSVPGRFAALLWFLIATSLPRWSNECGCAAGSPSGIEGDEGIEGNDRPAARPPLPLHMSGRPGDVLKFESCQAVPARDLCCWAKEATGWWFGPSDPMMRRLFTLSTLRASRPQMRPG
jgi:hypothetical protein